MNRVLMAGAEAPKTAGKPASKEQPKAAAPAAAKAATTTEPSAPTEEEMEELSEEEIAAKWTAYRGKMDEAMARFRALPPAKRSDHALGRVQNDVARIGRRLATFGKPELSAAIQVALDGVVGVRKLLANIPDSFVPPTAGVPRGETTPLKVGDKVRINDANRETLSDFFKPEQMESLEVAQVLGGGKSITFKSKDGTNIVVPRTYVKLAK